MSFLRPSALFTGLWLSGETQKPLHHFGISPERRHTRCDGEHTVSMVGGRDALPWDPQGTRMGGLTGSTIRIRRARGAVEIREPLFVLLARRNNAVEDESVNSLLVGRVGCTPRDLIDLLEEHFRHVRAQSVALLTIGRIALYNIRIMPIIMCGKGCRVVGYWNVHSPCSNAGDILGLQQSVGDRDHCH